MKYYTSELWSEMNHIDGDIRSKAIKQWQENTTAYAKSFEEIKTHFPPNVVQMDRTNCLHDCVIESISINHHSEQGYICQLVLCNSKAKYTVKMSGISRMNIAISSFQNCILGRLSWGYHEFELSDRNTLQLSVLCDADNELSFEFDHISLIAKQKARLFCKGAEPRERF